MTELQLENYPENLYDLIKYHVEKNGDVWNEDKHFFYIDCTRSPQILVFEKWDYTKAKIPTVNDLTPKTIQISSSILKQNLRS